MTAKHERNAEMLALRHSGSSVQEIADKYGISRSRAGYILRHEPSFARHAWTPDELEQLRALHSHRLTLAAIGAKLGRTAAAVRQRYREEGMAPRGHVGTRRSATKRATPRKLTSEEVLAIRTLVAGKMMSRVSCAQLYGVHRSMIGLIARGQRWAWLNSAMIGG